MKVWFDTEFMEDGKTIELLSIGAVREDGACFYAEFEEADYMKANEWVAKNVLPKLVGASALKPRRWIVDSFRTFCGEKPEFWAYYSAYDWVSLCQMYGRMVDLPKGWPLFCRDVKQLCVDRGNPRLPEQTGEHHALADAKWTKAAWDFLSVRPEETTINLLVELENLFDAFADRVDKCESRIECRDVCHDFMGRLGAIKARGMREPQRSEEPNG